MLAVMVQLHPNETSVVGVGVLLAASEPSPLHRAGLVEHCSGDNEIELEGGGGCLLVVRAVCVGDSGSAVMRTVGCGMLLGGASGPKCACQ